MSYQEDGKDLDNLASFTGTGFESFPNTYYDNQHAGSFSTLNDEQLANKTNEYGAFLQRDDLMQRARATGERVLDHLLFESAWRDGVYRVE